MAKIGRNDLCYCGSGKKYKHCHMKEDQEKEKQARAVKEAARYVRRDLLKFGREDRFSEAFAKALVLYWNELYEFDNAEEMSMDEAFRFVDWFTFDYDLGDGRYLIQTYAEERYPDLSSAQQQLIDSWKTAPPASAYELLAYEGQQLQLRDYFTGEEVEIYESGGRGVVEIGEIILGRLVPVADHLEFSVAPAYLPADEIGDLREKMEAAEKTYRADHPEATHDQFMRHNNFLITHHALAQAEAKGRPPVARLNPDRPDKKTQKVARQMKRFKR